MPIPQRQRSRCGAEHLSAAAAAKAISHHLLNHNRVRYDAAADLAVGLFAAEENHLEQEQWEEFSPIRAAAYEALRFGTLIEPRHSRPACQFLILPSFDNRVSWDVSKDREQTRL